MLSCVILDDYQDVALSFGEWGILRDKVNIRVVNQYISDEAELVSTLKDADIVVIMRERTVFDAKLLSQLPKLKLIVTSGMRNAAIDLEFAKLENIIVSGTRNFGEPPTELTWALIHALSRNIVEEANAVRSGGWQHTIGVDLYGKTLGLLGFGKIGQQVAKVAKALGMRVLAWSENLTEAVTSTEDVMLAPSKEALLKESDIISVHLVLSERTKHIISDNEFKLMKKSAYLINTSRANIIDQSALLYALTNNNIKAAAADVFDTEPLPTNHPFRQLRNFLPTPHIGYVTERNYQAYYGDVVENIVAYIAGNPIRVIN